MSKATDSVTTVFELQRTALDQSREAIKQSVEFQQRAASSLVDGLGTQRSAGKEGVGMSKRAVHAYFDALESATPGDAADFDELRAAVDEAFDEIEGAQDEAWEAVREAVEQGTEAYEAVADSYVEGVDSSFDAFLEAHERVEAQVTEAADVAADAVEIDVDAE